MPKVVKQMMPYGDEEGTRFEMMVAMSKQCIDCNHLRLKPITCNAYPKGIPKFILDGKHDHTKPYKGDNGILYERRW